jgi:hypothetical protein
MIGPMWKSARQIICMRKQHTNRMEDDIKRILQDKQFHLQLKSEQKEIIQHHFLRVRWLWMNRKMIGEAIYIRVSDRK